MIAFLVFYIAICPLLYSQSTPKTKPTVKKSAPVKSVVPPIVSSKDTYDPTKLGPGEVACGRKGLVTCHCMKARLEKSDAARKKCGTLFGRDRLECIVSSDVCEMEVIDVDLSWQEDVAMAVECKRSCTKARCECCQT